MDRLFAQTITDNQLWVLLTGAGSVISTLFWLLYSAMKDSKDRALAEKDRALLMVEESNKSYREIAEDALRQATMEQNRNRKREGKTPITMMAPVVPESHSPSTKTQREAADIQTKRAQIAALKLASGDPPKPEPEHAEETTIPDTRGPMNFKRL